MVSAEKVGIEKKANVEAKRNRLSKDLKSTSTTDVALVGNTAFVT